jgi:hypothetical protein
MSERAIAGFCSVFRLASVPAAWTARALLTVRDLAVPFASLVRFAYAWPWCPITITLSLMPLLIEKRFQLTLRAHENIVRKRHFWMV